MPYVKVTEATRTELFPARSLYLKVITELTEEYQACNENGELFRIKKQCVTHYFNLKKDKDFHELIDSVSPQVNRMNDATGIIED